MVAQGLDRSAGYTEVPSTSRQHGANSAEPLDGILAELEVDPLDALIAELERIEGHEAMLQDAVANDKAVVVHPRPEALAAPRAPDTPATPQSFIVEGGLASFEVAQDLLYLDFSQPEHAPQEFRNLSYDPERTTSFGSGNSGSFGQLDPASLALHDYLRRIQQQAQQVRNLIDGQRQLRPVEKVLAPGGSSADLHADEIPAGQAPHYTMQAPGEPPGMPRTSEGAVSIEAKLGKSLGSQGLAGHAAGVKDGGLQEVLAGPHVTITAHSATIGQGEKQQSSVQKTHNIVRKQFYGRAEPKGPAAGRNPT
ncbi:g12011 [Coccomyxa viridis]|uniref:G12011 protein n=1 Tax=Coccomyxa viridis TaxID=1274662 RepID=A0ABP1G9C0_9CHLO